MGRYRKLEQQLGQLEELQGIIASMKTLSQLELHKLGGMSEEQYSMVQMLERMAADFMRFHPQAEQGEIIELWLVIGSERGFCGDFNSSLLRRLWQDCPDCLSEPQRVVVVGRKLWMRMEEELPGFVPLEGASVSEELPGTLSQVVDAVRRQLLTQQLGGLRLLYHGDEQGGIVSHRLLPPQIDLSDKLPSAPPLLQLSPEHFYAEFLQHYLYLALAKLFTLSLLAENHQRVQHLDGAVRRLDERLAILGSHARTLRQEEITEEIETILLGSGLETLGLSAE